MKKFNNKNKFECDGIPSSYRTIGQQLPIMFTHSAYFGPPQKLGDPISRLSLEIDLMILTWSPALVDLLVGAFFEDFPAPNFPPLPPLPPFPAYQ
jgi:hypothetical protein